MFGDSRAEILQLLHKPIVGFARRNRANQRERFVRNAAILRDDDLRVADINMYFALAVNIGDIERQVGRAVCGHTHRKQLIGERHHQAKCAHIWRERSVVGFFYVNRICFVLRSNQSSQRFSYEISKRIHKLIIAVIFVKPSWNFEYLFAQPIPLLLY